MIFGSRPSLWPGFAKAASKGLRICMRQPLSVATWEVWPSRIEAARLMASLVAMVSRERATRQHRRQAMIMIASMQPLRCFKDVT